MVHDEDDPWAEFLRPPPNETPAQMILRQKKEKDATLLNDMCVLFTRYKYIKPTSALGSRRTSEHRGHLLRKRRP